MSLYLLLTLFVCIFVSAQLKNMKNVLILKLVNIKAYRKHKEPIYSNMTDRYKCYTNTKFKQILQRYNKNTR